MQTIKKDVYNEILELVNIGFGYNSELKKFAKISNISDKWDLLIPESVQDILGIYRKSSLTYIVSGKPSKYHNTTDSSRERLKTALRGRFSQQYQTMYNHVHEMIKVNAAIEVYSRSISHKQLTFECDCIYRFMDREEKAVQRVYTEIIDALGERLRDKFKDVESDTRISASMKSYIWQQMNNDPERALEILIFLALFTEDDGDKEFFAEFESHYIEKRTNHYEVMNSKENEVSKRTVQDALHEYDLKFLDTCNLSAQVVKNDKKTYIVICLNDMANEM